MDDKELQIKIECIENNLEELRQAKGFPEKGTYNPLDYSYYYEMVSRLHDKGKLIIAIGVDESIDEAHFHVFRNEIDFKLWKNGTCLLFKDNKYINHGKNMEILTKDELNHLGKQLRSKPLPGLWGDSNWQFLINLWNANNYDFCIDLNTPMPEYRTMKLS
ncbi:MAG: hypothetical protein HDR04_20585 [Lachnospiraceae bacterium]|nr:hypothetical protein [Lachnospiraceae bacterium]